MLWAGPPEPLHCPFRYGTLTRRFFYFLQGFTNWSSTRTPNEVFTLLQTLFGRFDRIAQRRKVFKIETIGGESFSLIPGPTSRH